MKEYHLGVVATFDENACTWDFRATFINGDDSPFMEMQEVYNYDTYEWEDAFMSADDGTEQRSNYVLLEEAVDIAQKRLNEGMDHYAT